ncbi:MAG: site-specific DNA-methyltransferase [Chloroflexi bacterium]|nr:site-specific DNA-methyltransferase [Chloroflexota bacterium]MCL5074821.1 site-specific DNA-methyltransferase [Chloroflexota bacterium]
MSEIPDGSIHLVVTSPPYYNAPFDYPYLFCDYDEFLGMLGALSEEIYRVLVPGRIVCFVTDDMLVDGERYPIVADTIRIMRNNGFRYRDKIVWRKPEGYVRISHRSGVALRHPYPMYFYLDNIQESILIFQKGRFDYSYVRQLDPKVKESSRIDLAIYQAQKWYLSVWDITNVLPREGRIEKGIAAFPEEIPERLIRLFTFMGETVLDPFLGSGTTAKVARALGRNSYGYEIDSELFEVIERKLAYQPGSPTEDEVELIIREDARRLRSRLQERIATQKGRMKRPRKRRTEPL